MPRLVALTLVVLSVAASARAEKPAVAVLDIQGTGIDEALLPTLTEILTVEIDSLGTFKVIGGRDIQSMLGFEKQKDVIGCTDAACLAEIGGALGVDRIVASHIGKVGSTFVVNIKLINIRMATTEGRVYETVKGETDALIETVRRSVSKLFGNAAAAAAADKPAARAATPAPAAAQPTASTPAAVAGTSQPSAAADPTQPVASATEQPSEGGGVGVVPIVLWAAGGAGVVAGIIFGVQANSAAKEAQDLSRVGGQLSAKRAVTMSTVANVSYIAGGALVAGGFLVWLLSGDDAEPKTALAPVFGPEQLGFAFSTQF